MSLLRQEYRDDLTLEEAKGLALKVLAKTMDTTTLTKEKNIDSIVECSPFPPTSCFPLGTFALCSYSLHLFFFVRSCT